MPVIPTTWAQAAADFFLHHGDQCANRANLLMPQRCCDAPPTDRQASRRCEIARGTQLRTRRGAPIAFWCSGQGVRLATGKSAHRTGDEFMVLVTKPACGFP